MAISGDTKENYKLLQLSTGERFAHMADRLTTPEVFEGLDENGRAGNEELADWLRKQSDDEEAVKRHTDPDEATVAAQKRQDQAREDQDKARDNKPQDRQSPSARRQNG
jgi:Cft2 family RNA processing exonuclease